MHISMYLAKLLNWLSHVLRFFPMVALGYNFQKPQNCLPVFKMIFTCYKPHFCLPKEKIVSLAM